MSAELIWFMFASKLYFIFEWNVYQTSLFDSRYYIARVTAWDSHNDYCIKI